MNFRTPTRYLVGASLGVLALAAMGASARAQTVPQPTPVSPAGSPPTEVQEVIVTANKREEVANKVGMSLTVLSKGDLLAEGVIDTSDLVKVVPGFNYTQSGYGIPVYSMRGIGFYDVSLGASPAVAIYVDEVPLPYSILSTGAQLDVQQVEVMKGPQGTLFGQNTTGGAINYIAAKPTKDFEAGSDLSFGRFDEVDAEGYVSGPLSDTAQARLAVRYLGSGDMQQSYTRDAGTDEEDIVIGRLLLDWQPTSRLSFNFNLNGWLDRSVNPAQQYIGPVSVGAGFPPALLTYPRAPANDQAVDFDPGTNFRRNDTYGQLAIRGVYTFSPDLALTSITSVQRMDRYSPQDDDGTAISNFSTIDTGYIDAVSQEVRLNGSSGDRLKYVAGVNFEDDVVKESLYALYKDSSFPFDGVRNYNRQHADTEAAFGSIDYRLTDALTAQAGVRYTSQQRNFEGCSFDTGDGTFAGFISAVASAGAGHPVVIPPGGCATLSPSYVPGLVYGNLNQDNTSWRFNLNYQLADNELLYANVSRGYKNGAYGTGGVIFSPAFKPASQESVIAYEAGFKLGLFDRTLQLNGSLFYYDYENKQVRGRILDPVLGPLNALINIPKSSVKGAEVDVQWLPVKGLAFNFGGTYSDSEILGGFTNYNYLGVLQNFSGEAYPLAPKWQLDGDVQYTFPVNGRMNGFIGGNSTYQSETNSALGDPEVLAIRAYALVDLRAGVQAVSGKWRVMAWVRNLTDTYYWTYTSDTGVDALTRLPGEPRTYGVTLSCRY
jgi:outer membrane receptor protein involved in Fe transport